jgi:hypothetical protein
MLLYCAHLSVLCVVSVRRGFQVRNDDIKDEALFVVESLVVELCHGKTKLKLSTVDEITLNKLKDLGIDVL